MRAVLEKYSELVFQTADLLASWPFYDKKAERYILGPPVIPAQENFDPLTTWNPTFELEYWRFGIGTAQRWRERLGLPKNPKWDDVLFRLSKLPEKDGIYLAAESQPDLWERARVCAMREGRRQRMSEPRSSFVRRRAWTAARLGRRSRDHAPYPEGGGERLGPASDLGLGLAHAGDDRDANR